MTAPGSDLAGVTIILSGAGTGTTSTDASGTYVFTGLADGNYTVTPSKIGYTFIPPSSVLSVNGGDVTSAIFTAGTSTANTNLCNDFSMILVSIDSLGTATNFSTGTTITFQVQVTNISDQARTLTEEFNCGGFPFTVTDSSGTLVAINPNPSLKCPTTITPYQFAPGQTQTFAPAWHQNTNNGAQVPTGRYTVTATLPTDECSSISGSILSQTIEIQIR